MVQTSGNERLTAFVSTVVAVAILAAGVTAHQSAVPADTDVVQVASDLRFQLEMSLRHDSREQKARLAQLDAVMEAWNKSPQHETDRELLVAWLHQAGSNSLPGVMKPLPPAPTFSAADLARKGAPASVEHQVNKVPTSSTKQVEVKQPEARNTTPREQTSAPTLGTLYAQGPVQLRPKTAVTPTPADPLEEELIALQQPQSITSRPQETTAARRIAAPRPGIAAPPQAVEQNLLASVPVKNDSVDVPVTVNLTELAARIAGYHDSLDEVELALLRMDTPNLAGITEQIEKLDSMTRDYGFVQLYYDSLTPRERQSILEPRSMQATLDEVKRQLKRCEEVRDGDYLGTLNGDADHEFADLRAKIAEIERRTER